MRRDTLDSYSCIFNDHSGKDMYVTVTEWASGEGFDISIEQGAGAKFISLHHCELNAINGMIAFSGLEEKENK